LPKSLPIASVEISLFAHATESEEKVLVAARNLLPAARLENISFSKSNLRGHHGNPITLFEVKINGKDVIMPVVENLASNLSSLDKETLLNEIEKHLEKGSLFVRLDKQAAFVGSFRMAAADPIRIRLRFRKSRPEDIVQVCREIGLLP
jgi:RNA binding exosome subunit